MTLVVGRATFGCPPDGMEELLNYSQVSDSALKRHKLERCFDIVYTSLIHFITVLFLKSALMVHCLSLIGYSLDLVNISLFIRWPD